MPQDEQEQAKPATVTFKAKAGLPSAPKEMEVHAGEGDLRPWDLDNLPKFQQVGKPHTRFGLRIEAEGIRFGAVDEDPASLRGPDGDSEIGENGKQEEMQ